MESEYNSNTYFLFFLLFFVSMVRGHIFIQYSSISPTGSPTVTPGVSFIYLSPYLSAYLEAIGESSLGRSVYITK